MIFFEKIKLILFKPKYFFIEIREEKELKITLLYIITLFLFSAILYLLVNFTKILKPWPPSDIKKITIAIILLFINFIFLHIAIKMVKGKYGIFETFKVWVYSATPVILFAWIPYTLPFTSVWLFVLSMIGISQLHEISLWRTFLAIGIARLISYALESIIKYLPYY